MFKVKFENKEKQIILQTLGIREEDNYEIVLCSKKEDCESDKINVVFEFDNLDDVKEKIQFFTKAKAMYLYGETAKGDVRVEIRNIDYIEALGNDITAYVGKNGMSVNQKLYELEEHLKPFGFIRINKSQIVNVTKIEAVKTGFNGKLEITLANDTKFEVNRSYKQSFRDYLKER